MLLALVDEVISAASSSRWAQRAALQLSRAGGKCDVGQLVSSSAPNTFPVLGLTMWTCLQAKQTTPHTFPRHPRIHCPRTSIAPDGRYSGRERDVSPWSNRDPGPRLCI